MTGFRDTRQLSLSLHGTMNEGDEAQASQGAAKRSANISSQGRACSRHLLISNLLRPLSGHSLNRGIALSCGRRKKAVRWNEDNLTKNHSERSSTMKIDEPPTPFNHGYDVSRLSWPPQLSGGGGGRGLPLPVSPTCAACSSFS